MSRPKTDPKTHRKNVALTLDPHILSSAKAICKLNGWSLSRTVDMLLKDWMHNRLRVNHEGVTQIVISSANAKAQPPAGGERENHTNH